MANRVTITDLAKAAGVSASTVDRIINRRGAVQRRTEEHVLAVAEQIGFHAVIGLRKRLIEKAPERTFGFLINRKDRTLYNKFGHLLTAATLASTQVHGHAVVRHMDDLSPEATAEAIRSLGAECDAVAGVCIDHPRVSLAVADLATAGVPFWSMFSDISAPERAGFVGANGWKMGRSAAWFFQRMHPTGGTVAVLTGSNRYLAHQEYDSGFRNALAGSSAMFRLLPTRETQESDKQAFDLVHQLLAEHPDLTGIFLAGGGVDGAIAALQSLGREKLTLISTEISDRTQGYLTEGLVDVAISHRAELVAQQVVHAMERAISPGLSPVILTTPQDIVISESI